MSDINTNVRSFFCAGMNTVSLAATSSSSRVLLPGSTGSMSSAVGGGPEQVQIYNSGGNQAYVEFGGSAVTAAVPNGATAGSYPVAPGAVVVCTVWGNRIRYAAAIFDSGNSGTLYFTPGDGT